MCLANRDSNKVLIDYKPRPLPRKPTMLLQVAY